MSTQTGDVVLLDVRAAEEFAAHPIVYSVTDVRPGSNGWAWLDGYELDSNGKARNRRAVYVNTERIPRAKL